MICCTWCSICNKKNAKEIDVKTIWLIIATVSTCFNLHFKDMFDWYTNFKLYTFGGRLSYKIF